ncbi:MAG: hypothetical protein K2L51_05755, partial [Clostridiales bacterium]|nr:hypothetical protein [Clostridiales bacterium]
KGVCGVAVDLITFDGKYRNIFAGLLGNTVVVEDMDTAIAVARKARYGFKIVTRDGEVLSPHGSITGGSKKSELTNVFGYEKEIEALNGQLAEMDKSLAELNAVRDEKAAVQRHTSEQIRTHADRLHKLEVEIATRTEALNKFAAADAELAADVQTLEEARNASAARVTAITSELDSVEELQKIVRDRKDDATGNSEEQRQQFDVLRRQRDELHGMMTSARVKVSTLDAQKSAAESEPARLKNNLEAAAAKIEYDTEQITENDTLIAQLDKEISSSVNAGGEKDSQRVKEIRFKLSNLDDYKQELNATLASLDGRRMELINELQALREKKNREEMQLL